METKDEVGVKETVIKKTILMGLVANLVYTIPKKFLAYALMYYGIASCCCATKASFFCCASSEKFGPLGNE